MADGRSLGLRRTLRRVRAFRKNELYAYMVVPGIRVPRYYYCCVPGTCLYFKAPSFLRPDTLTTSHTGSHGQSSGKILIAAKLIGGLLECLRKVREIRSPATPSSPTEEALKNTWYYIIGQWPKTGAPGRFLARNGWAEV